MSVPAFLYPTSKLPEAVNSYAQRNVQYTQRPGAEYGPGNEVKIQLDTGTPSAFLDPAQSYLRFKLKITNNNFQIDYVNFTYAGAAAFIDTLTITANGTVIEKITDYNVVFNHYQYIMGKAIKPYHMYIARPSDQIMSNNLNAIKLPMVDRRGYIMGAGPLTGYQYTGGYGNDKFLGVTTTNIMAPFPFNKAMNPNCFPDSIPPLSISAIPSWNELNPERMQDYFTFLTNVRCVPIGCTSALKPNADGYYLNPGYFNATKVNPAVCNVAASTTPITPFCATGTTFDTTNKGNTKVIPGVFEFDVTLPILSGVVGLLAEKALPTFLLNDFCITLSLAQTQRVFKCSMDPCRIIRGTNRDFVTNCAFPSVTSGQPQTLADYCLNGQGFQNISSSLNTLFNNPYPALGGTRNTMYTSLPFQNATVGLNAAAVNTGSTTGSVDNYMKFAGTKTAIVTNPLALAAQSTTAPIVTPMSTTATASASGGQYIPGAFLKSGNTTDIFRAPWEFGIPYTGLTNQAYNYTSTFTEVIRVPLRDSTCLYDVPPTYGTGVQTFLSQYILSPIGLSPGTLGLQSGTMGYGFTSTPVIFPPPEIAITGGITSNLTLDGAQSFFTTGTSPVRKTINTVTSLFTGNTANTTYTQDSTYLLGTPGTFFTPNGQIPQYLLSSGLACDTYGANPIPTFIPVTSEFSNTYMPFNTNWVTAFPTSFNPFSQYGTNQSNYRNGVCANQTGPSFFTTNTFAPVTGVSAQAVSEPGLISNAAQGVTLTTLPSGPGSLVNADSYIHNAYLMGTVGTNFTIPVTLTNGTNQQFVNTIGCASSVGFAPYTGAPYAANPVDNATAMSCYEIAATGSIAAPTTTIQFLENNNPFAGTLSINAVNDLQDCQFNWVTGGVAIVDSFYNLNEETALNDYALNGGTAKAIGYPLGPHQLNLASSNALYSQNVGSAVVAPLYPKFTLDFGQASVYGTFLNQSIPQSLGIMKYGVNAITKLIPSYVLTDAIFYTMQVLLPQEVAGAIVAAAATGAIEMETISITCTNTRMTKGATSQNVQLQIQLGCANTVFFLFRPEQVFANNDSEQIYYDSLCGYNPFASVEFASNLPSLGYGTSSLTVNNMLVSNNQDMSIQLQIGNDLKPRTPIRTVKEIGTELQKALHGLHSPDFAINITSSITFDKVNGNIVPVYDIYSDGGFLTTFIPYNVLQDQTKVYNPMLLYGTNPQVAGGTKNVQTVSTAVNNSLLLNVCDYYTMKTQTAPVNFYNINQMETPSSCFVLGFDLDYLYGSTGKVQSGTYLGNFQTSLNLTGLQLCKENLVYLTSIYYHQLKLSIQMGGTVAPYK